MKRSGGISHRVPRSTPLASVTPSEHVEGKKLLIDTADRVGYLAPMKSVLFVLFCLVWNPNIANAYGNMGYNCNTMLGPYSPELERTAQRLRAEGLAREEEAFRAMMSPFIRNKISLSEINLLYSSGLVLDIGRGRMSYAVDSYGETVYPVIVKVSESDSHTYWMTIEELEARTGNKSSSTR